MEDSSPTSKWIYVGRWIWWVIARWFPGFLLKRFLPIQKYQERILIVAEGVGPHIFVNPGRSPAIGEFNLLIFNALPFPVRIDGVKMKINIESQGLTNFDRVNREMIGGAEVRKLFMPECHLTDSQAKIVREYPNADRPCDCPTLRIMGSLQLKTPVGEIDKNFEVETRVFIYRGEVGNA